MCSMTTPPSAFHEGGATGRQAGAGKAQIQHRLPPVPFLNASGGEVSASSSQQWRIVLETTATLTFSLTMAIPPQVNLCKIEVFLNSPRMDTGKHEFCSQRLRSAERRISKSQITEDGTNGTDKTDGTDLCGATNILYHERQNGPFTQARYAPFV